MDTNLLAELIYKLGNGFIYLVCYMFITGMLPWRSSMKCDCFIDFTGNDATLSNSV